MNDNGKVLRCIGRIVAGGYEDHQKIRTTQLNRIRNILYNLNEGIDLDTPQDKKADDQKALGKEYNDVNIPKIFEAIRDKVTGVEFEYLQKLYDTVKLEYEYEKESRALMSKYIENEPIYTRFLKDIKGISAVLGANMIKEFGYCERMPHVSSLWHMCGLHVVDGMAPKRKRGERVDFSPRLRTLCWKIGDSFIKQRTDPYRGVYDQEKERQLGLMENNHDRAPQSRGHADNRARRKMVKIFLEHYWIVSRKLKGLPVSEPYVIERLGHTHYIEPKEAME